MLHASTCTSLPRRPGLQRLGCAPHHFGALMQLFDVRPEFFVKQIRCDRCGRLTDSEDEEFRESVSVSLRAVDASIFGDDARVGVDLCQHCLKLTLGPWPLALGSGSVALAPNMFACSKSQVAWILLRSLACLRTRWTNHCRCRMPRWFKIGRHPKRCLITKRGRLLWALSLGIACSSFSRP